MIYIAIIQSNDYDEYQKDIIYAGLDLDIAMLKLKSSYYTYLSGRCKYIDIWLNGEKIK